LKSIIIKKIDSPSGTALLLASTIGETRGKKSDSFVKYRKKSNNLKRKKNEVGISVIRGGNTVGEHSLVSYSDYENVTLTHEALDRSVFAKGAVELGLKLIKKRPGFYSVLDLL
jgi:Dihydrodipicolinate reductase